MRTNIETLVKNYQEFLGNNEKIAGVTVHIASNLKRERSGCASIIIDIVNENQDAENPQGFVSTALYIVEKKNGTSVIFVNNNNGDIVFNNFGPEAVEKSEKYIKQYLERASMSMLGLEIEKTETK
jgi:inorganic pyrophosphatase/exopolyphosphatase